MVSQHGIQHLATGMCSETFLQSPEPIFTRVFFCFVFFVSCFLFLGGRFKREAGSWDCGTSEIPMTSLAQIKRMNRDVNLLISRRVDPRALWQTRDSKKVQL